MDESGSDDVVIQQRYAAVSGMRSICLPCFAQDFRQLKAKKAAEAASGVAPVVVPRGRSGTVSFVCEECGKTERGAGKVLCQACSTSADRCEVCGGAAKK